MCRYAPKLLEHVKFAWVQYFSLLVPVYLVLSWLLIFIYRHKLSHVYAVDDKELVVDIKKNY